MIIIKTTRIIRLYLGLSLKSIMSRKVKSWRKMTSTFTLLETDQKQ